MAEIKEAKKSPFIYVKLKGKKKYLWDLTSPDKDRQEIHGKEIIPMYKTQNLLLDRDRLWEETNEGEFKKYWATYFLETVPEAGKLDEAFEKIEKVAEGIGKPVFRMHISEFKAQVEKDSPEPEEKKTAPKKSSSK